MVSPNLSDFIKTGNLEAMETALKSDPSLADGENEQGISHLLLAAYYRNEAAVHLIKKYKTRLDIFEASATGELERVREIILEAANLVNIFSGDGFTPLGLACFFGHPEVAQFLIAAGADVNTPSNNSFKVAPLHSASAISHLPLVKLLLDNGADINARQNSGVTPLHAAAHNGQLELTKLLIAQGADVNVKTENGQTPLTMAVEKGAVEVAGFIREKGGA